MTKVHKKNIIINQGETFQFRLIMTDSENDPIDLTDCVVKMQIRSTRRSESVILDLTTEGYITITDPLLGEITINIPDTVTELLDFSSAVYDVKLEMPLKTVRLVEGMVSLSLSVTREPIPDPIEP